MVGAKLLQPAITALQNDRPGTWRRFRIGNRQPDRLPGQRMRLGRSHGLAILLRSASKSLFSSGLLIRPAKPSNFPSRAISVATRMKACIATRASEPPTLMRRTPMAARSLTVKPNAPLLRKLTGFDDGFDLLARLDAGRIETIGTSVLKSAQPARDIVEIGHAANEAFGARREHDLAAGAVDGGTRGFRPRNRDVERVERRSPVVRRVLDLQAGNAGRHTAGYIFRKPVEIVSVAILEIRIQRQIGRRRELGEMREHGVAAERAVGIAL